MFGANFVLLMVVCCLGLSSALDEHLICKSMRQVFSPADHSLRPNRGVKQGAPGKRGAPGLKGSEGPKGARGPQGVVDYAKVNSTINEKLQPVISSFCEMERTIDEKMENLVTQLTSKIDDLTETLPTRILKRRGLCDVWYNNSCFWAIVHSSFDITHSKAVSICNNVGARVADIFDETHYDRLVHYLRKMIPTNTRYCFRLGLTYDYSANMARTQNGAESFARWYPGTPNRGSSSYTNIDIVVNQDESDRYQGFFNYDGNRFCIGVVCEFQGV